MLTEGTALATVTKALALTEGTARPAVIAGKLAAVTGCATKGTAGFFTLGLEGFTIRKLGGGAESFLLRFEICGVEYVVIVLILMGDVSRTLLRTRFERLLSPDKALTAAGVRSGIRDLFRSHDSSLTGLKIATPEGADTHTDELLHTQAKAGEHLTNLTLQPLFQYHAGAASAQAGNVFGLGLAFGNTYTLQQLNEHAVIESLIQSHPVLLLNAAAGVPDALAEGTIVRENQ